MLSLCQRGSTSCGACCGLYNRADLSREAAREELRRSTEVIARTPRTQDAFRAAAARRTRGLPSPLFPSVRICPLLGFLDTAETRVGCLAHPKATGGPDLRACGVYDTLTCEAFLCPSHAYLREDEADLIVRAARDFYLYGLVVTDAPFVHAVADCLATRAGVAPTVAALEHLPFRRALEAVLALKELLEPGSEGLYAAFRAGVERRAGGAAPSGGSPFAAVLEALGADARSGNDADALEGEVRRRMEACVAALQEASRRGSRPR